MSKPIKTIEDLRPDPMNANRGTPRGHGIIEHSIRKHGAGRPGLAAKDGTMIAGSQTLEEMAALGFEIVPVHTTGKQWPVHIRDDIEPGSPEAIEMAIEDNRSSELGLDWDASILVDLPESVDLSQLFSTDELSALLADVGQPEIGGDEFDTTPPEGPTRTAVGDLWSISGNGLTHRLIVGDCTDPLVVERLMGGEEINCVFTSPPYDQQRTYEGNMALDWRALVSGALLLATQHCASDAQLFVNLGLVHRDGRVVRYWDNLIADMEDEGWPLFGWYVWDKQTSLPVDWHGRLAISHEWVFHFAQSEMSPRKTIPTKTAGRSGGNSRRVADGQLEAISNNRPPVYAARVAYSVISVSSSGGISGDHPAPFPIALPETFMGAYAGDLWYDPFLGSGTSIIAAERAGRRCVGVEINPRYADLALARAEAAGLTCERQ